MFNFSICSFLNRRVVKIVCLPTIVTISIEQIGWNNAKDVLFLKECIFNITKVPRGIDILYLGLCTFMWHQLVKVISGILYLGLHFSSQVRNLVFT